MRHKKTSLFISGLFLSVEFSLLAIFAYVRSLFGAVFFSVIFGLDIYRVYRKIKFLRTKDPLTYEKIAAKRESQLGINSYYWNIWYRFADATEHEYIAQKLHEQFKKTH